MMFPVLLLVALSVSPKAFGQRLDKYEKLASEALQQQIVEHLCDSVMEGRGAGTAGGAAARSYILHKFDSLELRPFYYNRAQTFWHKGMQMHNVLGVVPALGPSDKYIVVSAHYDHLGTIKGKTFPGADDNASGVAALLAVAEMFSAMRRDSVGPGVNILFAAFDAKEYSMTGSKYFTSNLPFAPSQIICEINIDIIGSTLVPVHKNKPEYVIVLGRNTLPEGLRGAVSYANSQGKLGLDIDYTFYGSDDFTRTMYKLGDHYTFNQRGIPALFFTSGFHQNTLKTTDTPDIINYQVLAKRTRLIFRTIHELSRR